MVRTLPDPFELSTALSGSPGDVQRHVIAREEFLGLLIEDPRVQRLFSEWGAEFPSSRAARREKAKEKAHVFADFAHKTLGIAWPWLDLELIRLHGWILEAATFRQDVDLTLFLRAPAAAFTFTPAPHESKEAALVRFNLESATYRATLNSRRTRDGGEHVRRNVRWFYRNKIEQPRTPAPVLTTEYLAEHSSPPQNARNTVEGGIDEARRLLEEIPAYRYNARYIAEVTK